MNGFQEQQLFSGAARVQGFQPQETPDLTTGLRENAETRQANLKRLAAEDMIRQASAINKKVETYEAIGNLGIPMAKELAELTAKSFLDSQAIKAQDDYRKSKDVGTTPEGTKAYADLLEQARKEGAITSEAAAQLAKQGGSLEQINYIKGLPRYRQLYAMQAYLTDKRNALPQAWDQFRATDTQVYTDVNGQKFTVKDLETNPNKHRSKIVFGAFTRKQYLKDGFSQEFNPNPEVSRLYNEGLNELENSYLTSVDARININESEQLVNSGIQNFLSNGNYNDLVRAYLNSYDPKTGKVRDNAAALAAAEATVVGLYASGQISREAAVGIRNQTVEWDKKGRSFDKFYANRLYAKDGLFAQINAVDKRKLDIAETQDKIKLQQFEDAFNAQKRKLQAEGRRFTNEDIQELVSFGRDDLGLSMNDMSFMLQDYLTAQEADDEAQMRRLQPIIDQQGFVEMSDLEGVSPELIAELNTNKLIRDEGVEELTAGNKQEAKDTIRAFTGARIKIEEGQPEPVEFVRQYNNAYRAYESYMRDYMLGGMTQTEAQTLAIKKLNENNAQGTYTRTDLRPLPNSKFSNDLSSAQGNLNDQSFDHTTTILPNSEPYLEQLDKWTKGEAAFPRYYTLAAASNKYISGWDLASQQYRIKYNRELGKDARRRAFENQPAAVQAVLNFHPTERKLERALTTNYNNASYDVPFTRATRQAVTVSPIDGVNHPFFVAIGINEGTRRADGGYNPAYRGHTDPAVSGPAAGKTNKGTVSSRDTQFATPEAVDAHWTKHLANTQKKHENAVASYGLAPGTADYNDLMFNILDLEVQAPAAVEDFVKSIPDIIREGVTPSVIGKYRAKAFIEPSGRLNAPGFGNSMVRLQLDQTRRAGTFTLKRRGR
jgi:hypothetical protein